jgi:hypothetical protein
MEQGTTSPSYKLPSSVIMILLMEMTVVQGVGCSGGKDGQAAVYREEL